MCKCACTVKYFTVSWWCWMISKFLHVRTITAFFSSAGSPTVPKVELSIIFIIICDYAFNTCSCDWRERRASRLWMTFVRSKQSMQLLRKVPSWFNSTFPSASTRKYLHPYAQHYFLWRVYCYWTDTSCYTSSLTQSHPAFQQPCPVRSEGGATSCGCTPYESQKLCT